MGNNETFEAFTSNIYSRRVLSGEFICINKHMCRDLIKLNLWSKDVRDQILANNGSIQKIKIIPDKIKKLYRTTWELS